MWVGMYNNGAFQGKEPNIAEYSRMRSKLWAGMYQKTEHFREGTKILQHILAEGGQFFLGRNAQNTEHFRGRNKYYRRF